MSSRDNVPSAVSSQPPSRLRRVAGKLPAPFLIPARKLWQVWLHLLASRGWVRDFLIPILITAAARFGIALFQRDRLAALGNNAFAEAAFDVAVLLGSMAFVRWSITWGVPEMMSHVRDIAAATQEPKREFLRDFATAQVRSTRDIVGGLTGEGYPVVNPTAMKPWFSRFFANGGAEYIGVDSHRPAAYMTEFGWFLDVHAESLGQRGNPVADRRVLTTPRADLSRDQRAARPDYQSFYRWHQDHAVEVAWVDKGVADRLRKTYGIGDADVALWEAYAVLFESHSEGGGLSLGMWFPGEPEREHTTYEKIRDFVEEIQKRATSLEKVAPGLDLVDRELASEWINYVDPVARADPAGAGRFLIQVLRGKSYVFDAAAGIACDSVALMRAGFHVFTNEVDGLLAAQAQIYAAQQDVKLQFTSLLWEDLPDQIPGNLRFDVVLCLGNSICLVDDAQGRLDCLRALGGSLRPDGLLVIDERNFQYMLDNARMINSDPISHFAATTSGDVMYRGVKIRGYPANIDKQARVVQWRFFRNSPPVTSRSELEERRLRGPDLVLHAFTHGELLALLRDAGFRNIDVYADLKLVASDAGEMPDLATIGDANFITYVARRAERRPTPGAGASKAETPGAPGA